MKLFERKSIKRSPDEDHAIVFEKIFGTRYTVNKDYLLRNEYRLIRQLLEEFLVEKELLKTAKDNVTFKDLFLLKALTNRQNHELAGILAPQKIKAATEAYQFDMAAEMSSILFRLHAFYRAPKPDNMKKGIEALSNKKSLLDQHHFNEYQLIRTQVGFIQRSLDHSIDFSADFPKDSGYNHEIILTPLSEFYALKFRTYMLPHGQEKIDLLKEAYKLMEQFHNANSELQTEQEFCILTLALEHFLIGDYLSAEEYYQEYFQIFDRASKNYLPALYNFASNQIKLRKFEQVLQIIEENEGLLVGNNRFSLFFNILRTSSYLRLAKPVDLREHLPINFSGMPRNFNYYYRLVFCALYYLEGNIEIAIQEARNFANVVKNDDELLPYHQMASSFIRFFQWKDNLKSPEALKSLEKKVRTFSDKMEPEYRDFMPFLWIKEEISKALN